MRSHIHLLLALVLTLLLINPALTSNVKRAPASSSSVPPASSASSASSAATSSDSVASSSAPGSSVPATGAASTATATSGATSAAATTSAAAGATAAVTGATTINGTPMGPAGCTPTDIATPVVGQLIPPNSNPCTPVVAASGSGGGDTAPVNEPPPAQPSIELPPLPSGGELVRVSFGMLVGMVGVGVGLVGWQAVF